MKKDTKKTETNERTAVQTLPGCGPSVHAGSSTVDTRSGDGKQIGRTQRLNCNGVFNLNNDKSFAISEEKKRKLISRLQSKDSMLYRVVYSPSLQ